MSCSHLRISLPIRFFDWFTLDREACTALRRALDREGGAAIAIDYPLMHSHVELENADRRRHLLAGLTDLPFDYLWVRASGLAPDAGPLTVRRFLSAMSDLRDLGQPIILDYLGGLLGSAAIAFGVASGKAHGIGERERFDVRDWHKPPRKKDPEQKFGRTQRIAVPRIRALRLNQRAGSFSKRTRRQEACRVWRP
jgi:hypothetical protein